MDSGRRRGPVRRDSSRRRLLFRVEVDWLPKRKPWDWLDLLIVPVVLAIVGFVFTSSENRATRVAAEQRAQDEALQAYLDQLGQMLLDGEKPLRESKEGDEVRTLARARALTVLNRLDGRRKATVVQFLYESGLIGRLESPKSMGSMTMDPSPAGGAAGQRGGRDGLERNRAHDRGSEVRSPTRPQHRHPFWREARPLHPAPPPRRDHLPDRRRWVGRIISSNYRLVVARLDTGFGG